MEADDLLPHILSYRVEVEHRCQYHLGWRLLMVVPAHSFVRPGMRRSRNIARSQAAKMRWADPTYRAKRREAAKARWADPSMREKMIAGMRATGRRRRYRAAALHQTSVTPTRTNDQWRF